MDYSEPILGWLGRFKKPGPEEQRKLTGRSSDEVYRQVRALADDNGVTISDVMNELTILGLKKYSEELDRYAQAQDDLAERLEALGYDDFSINGLFEKYHDLSELNREVVKLEEKRE